MAAPKPVTKTATAAGENHDVALAVTLYLDPADAERLVGDDLGKHFVLAEVKVEPRSGKEIYIDRDDFVLRTDSNGAHTTPFAPSQIAGSGALVIREVTDSRAAASPGSSGPFGHKRTAPKQSADTTKPRAEDAKSDSAKPADQGDKTLLQTLKEKELPQGKTPKPVAGLLYFEMEKQKMKDLEVAYGPKEDRIVLRFK